MSRPANPRTIGKLAKETGVSVETIRFYERRGLLSQPRKPAEGYRHYGDNALAIVRYIRIAQELGLSLRDIEALRFHLNSRKTFCAALRATVEGRLQKLEKDMASLVALKANLEGFLVRCQDRPSHLTCPILDELGALDAAVPRSSRRQP